MPVYDKQFYDDIRETSRHAARTIIPMVNELIGPVSTVIDIGCGQGVWLSVWRENGATRAIGVDGEHVDRALLEIPEEDFIASDLSRPLPVKQRFDIAMTLEVVEHLPPERAESMVDELVALAPVILFSAAIPGQLGEGHINEEWQDTWADRFERRGYRTLDPIRSKIWWDRSISWWYQQNILMFASEDTLAQHPHLAEADAVLDRARLSVVHPRQYLMLLKHAQDLHRKHLSQAEEIEALRRKLAALSGETTPSIE
jgi:SAM-dependent methyltransferase